MPRYPTPDGEALKRGQQVFFAIDRKSLRHSSGEILNSEYSIISDATIYAIDPSHYLFETIPFLEWFTDAQVAAMTAYLEYAVEVDETAAENLEKIREAQQARGEHP